MENQIEVSANSVTDFNFWYNDQRSEIAYLSGSEDEITIDWNPITKTMCAWARFATQRKESRKNKTVWEVVYKSNVNDKDTRVVLEGMRRKIETAIKKVCRCVSTSEMA